MFNGTRIAQPTVFDELKQTVVNYPHTGVQHVVVSFRQTSAGKISSHQHYIHQVSTCENDDGRQPNK